MHQKLHDKNRSNQIIKSPDNPVCFLITSTTVGCTRSGSKKEIIIKTALKCVGTQKIKGYKLENDLLSPKTQLIC